MTQRLFTFAALSLLLAAAPAYAEPTQTNNSETTLEPSSNGGYTMKNKAEHTDSAGTTIKQDSTKKVDVDSNGNKTTTVDIKNSTDPKGLLNKQTEEIHNKAVIKDGQTEYKHKKTVNGTTVEDVDQKTPPN